MSSIQPFTRELQHYSNEIDLLSKELVEGARLVPYPDNVLVQSPPHGFLHRLGQALRRWNWSTEDEITALNQTICKKVEQLLKEKLDTLSEREKKMCEKEYLKELYPFLTRMEAFINIGLENYKKTCLTAPSHVLSPYKKDLEERGNQVKALQTHLNEIVQPLIQQMVHQLENYNAQMKISHVSTMIRSCISEQEMFSGCPTQKFSSAFAKNALNNLYGSEIVKKAFERYQLEDQIYIDLHDLNAILVGIAAMLSPSELDCIYYGEQRKDLMNYFNLTNAAEEAVRNSKFFYQPILTGTISTGLADPIKRLEMISPEALLSDVSKLRSIKLDFIRPKEKYAKCFERDAKFLQFISSTLNSYLIPIPSIQSYGWDALEFLWADYLIQLFTKMGEYPLHTHTNELLLPCFDDKGLPGMHLMRSFLLSDQLQVYLIYPLHTNDLPTFPVRIFLGEQTKQDPAFFAVHQKMLSELFLKELLDIKTRALQKNLSVDLLGQGSGAALTQECAGLLAESPNKTFIEEINVYAFRPEMILKKHGSDILKKYEENEFTLNLRYFTTKDTQVSSWRYALLGTNSETALPAHVKVYQYDSK